ncbi:MAG: InlB B-repeat-containing protein [Eubacterium sp.]|nr:InlB B-repeat-containing protein [Eubacterium sp.]
MRCKNCGSENDSNLYICQNCGSPLYEENEETTPQESTQVFKTISEKPSSTQKYIDDFERSQNRQRVSRADRYEQPPVRESKGKNQAVIIVVLVIILLAVIGATVFAIMHAKSNNTTTAPTTSTTESTTEEIEEYTTESTTKGEATINLIANDGGSVSGEGKYKKGETITVKATAYDGYYFKGWYRDGDLVSSDRKYTFTVKDDVTLKARFGKEETKATKKPSTSKEHYEEESETEEPDQDIV